MDLKEYSEQEIKLIKEFNLMDFAAAPCVMPHTLFREMAVSCFLNPGKYPNHIEDSVRGCMVWLDSGKYRATPEFDALIQL